MVIRIVLVSAAFQLRKVDGGAWESVANMTLLAAAGLQLGAGMLALYYTDQISSTRYNELKAMPDDEEVAAADAKEEEAKVLHRLATDWDRLQGWAKSLLVVAAITGVLSTYAFVGFDSYCFKPWEVTDCSQQFSIKDFVKPVGRGAVGMQIVCFMCYLIFNNHGKGLVKMFPKPPPGSMHQNQVHPEDFSSFHGKNDDCALPDVLPPPGGVHGFDRNA